MMMFLPQYLGLGRGALDGVPSWLLRAGGLTPELDLDFVNDRAFLSPQQVSIASLLACTRASSGFYTNVDGTLTNFDSNVLRYGDQGLLVEESRTNVALWSADLTNAAWVKTDCTAALDQVGPDGLINSISSLTATGANATCLQAITLASSARFQTCYVKRLTGSGTVEMTMDNGATWTAITVTGAFTRVSIPTQTLANPTVGWRIVTSGDSIAVGFINNENGTFASSYIPTTASSATRAGDQVMSVDVAWFNALEGTVFCEHKKLASVATGVWQFHGTGDRQIGVRSSAPDAPFALVLDNTGSEVVNGLGAGASFGDNVATAFAFKENDFAMSTEGGAGNADTSGELPTITSFQLGGYDTASVGFHYIRRLAYFNSRLLDVLLQALTA